MSDTVHQMSIGLPVYNGETYLPVELDSLLAQTFDDFELVISDNASSDRTGEICRDYAAGDPRIRYHRNDVNLGICPNFNRVFELSRGQYFKWACHDDRHAPTFLETCIDVLERNPDVVISHANEGLIDERGEPLSYCETTGAYLNVQGQKVWDCWIDKPHLGEGPTPQERFHDVLFNMNSCTHIFGVMRSDELRRIDWAKNYFGYDKVLCAEMALLGRFHQCEETLFFRRWHPGQATNHTTKEKARVINPHHYSGNPQLLMLRDYLQAIWRTPLTLGQRAAMMWTLAQMVHRPGLLQKIFVPGPNNYLGIDFSRALGRAD